MKRQEPTPVRRTRATTGRAPQTGASTPRLAPPGKRWYPIDALWSGEFHNRAETVRDTNNGR